MNIFGARDLLNLFASLYVVWAVLFVFRMAVFLDWIKLYLSLESIEYNVMSHINLLLKE